MPGPSSDRARRSAVAGDGEPVTRELDDGVALLTMRLAPHNLLCARLLAEPVGTLDWAMEQGARAVVLRSGLRHFCAGADLEVFRAAVDRGEVPDLSLVALLR